MAVYEHGYKPYTGSLTPEWSRFLILPRHAFRDVFRSKFFIAFFALCFLYPLVAAILIYLHHNVNAIALMKLDLRELVPINASFFHAFVTSQCSLGFFLTVLIGPPLISRDLANNALPLYLSRPFTRKEYVVGKMSVILILVSLITWIPGLLLFLLQAYLEGAGWLGQNLRLAGAIFLASLVWIVVLAVMSLAVSAWLKWRVVASGALLAIFFIPSAFGEIVNALFRTRLGHLISLGAIMNSLWRGLFGLFQRQTGQIEGMRNGRIIEITMLEPPLWASWLALAIICGLCVLLLMRKVRAYEVVK
ncbi:MAG: type transport system permease protein [Pyrinomonadaceae bacterium]|nr:type transport system permease protein [Pyrinomonadaceae bacterium]MDX6268793.1 type transport system permease protein [Acidobacteriota bacterium]